MKNFKKVLALVLAVVMLVSFATVASAKTVTSSYYKDGDKINFAEAVDVLGSIGVLNGFPDDTFRPQATITRAQAAKIIAMFDNGATDINKLYASANPFADCVDHWAESYIAYGVKTGILAGMGGNKFAPEENVTGVQFLKMALIVLGYNAKEEGLEGKNWDVNTLALAKRVGLTASLDSTIDYTADLTREQAAVIMLDALRANTVVYASALGTNGKLVDDGEWPYITKGTIYWTVAGAVSTGKVLGESWGLEEGYAEDAFCRPYRTWTLNKNVIGSYMYPVSAEYTTAYDMCQVLVDLGVAKNNTGKKVEISNHYVNGADAYVNLTGTHRHTVESLTACNETTAKGGAQGTLTQVFYMYDGTYRITEIDTWLASVVSAKKVSTNRDGHLTSYTESTIEAIGNQADFDYCNNRNITEMTSYTDMDGLKKGDMVLVSLSAKKDCEGAAYNVVAATSKTGSFNGYKYNAYPSQTRIDGEYVNDSHHFHMGWNDSKSRDEFGTKVFYFDRYENVIGMENPSAGANEYLVIDRLWLQNVAGDPILYADVVGIDAQITKGVVVAKLDGENAKFYAQNYWDNGNTFAFLNGAFYDQLDLFGTDSDGLYYIDNITLPTAEDVVIVKGNPEINSTTKFIGTDSATKYLIHENDGTYTAVTGYRNIDSMKAAKAEYVDENNDGIAEIVYLKGIVRNGDNSVAYVTGPATNWVEVYEGTDFNKMIVYVDGVATEVYVEKEDVALYFNSQTWGADNAGFYKFHYLTIGSKTFVEVVDTMDKLNTVYNVKRVSGDVLTVDGNVNYAIADGVVVYSVRVDGTVVKEDATAYLDTYGLDEVKLVFNGNGEVAAIYALETIEY